MQVEYNPRSMYSRDPDIREGFIRLVRQFARNNGLDVICVLAIIVYAIQNLPFLVQTLDDARQYADCQKKWATHQLQRWEKPLNGGLLHPRPD